MEERVSNYEIMKHRMAEEFLKYDISKKLELWNLKTDEDYVYLTFVSDDYRVSRKNGEVEVRSAGPAAMSETENEADQKNSRPAAGAENEGHEHITPGSETKEHEHPATAAWLPADYNSAMTIYDLLCYASDLAHPSGNQVPMQSLSTVHTRDTYAGKGMFFEATEYFAAHGGTFGLACEKMGGYAWGKGDYGYLLPVFEGMEMSLQVWEADEDFDAQMTVLTDQNTLMYMHYETMWFMVGHVIGKVREKMSENV